MADLLKKLGRAAPRWGLLLCALLFGAALMGTAARAYRDAVAAERVMARAQGEALLQRLRRELFPRTPDPEELALILTSYQELGLRHLTVVGRDGVERRAGEARVGAPAGAEGAAGEAPAGASSPGDDTIPPGQLQWRDGRYRLRLGRRFRSLPGPWPGGSRGERLPHLGGRAGPSDGPSGRPDGLAGRWREPPDLVIEFEALGASELRRRAVVGLWVASGATGLLTLAALFLWRLTMRAQRMEQELGRQRHLATLGEMSAVLAHEIRNPLAALKGHAQLLEEEVPDGRPRQRVGRVVDEASRLERLTSDLLAFARSGAIVRREVSPAAVLLAAAEAVGRGRVTLHLDRAPGRFLLDPDRMQQVLGNLLENALDAGGEAAEPGRSGVEAAVEAEGDRLVFTVRDRGPGVPLEDRERIFEAFHTSKTKGTGLGLAVARRIVELHGGRLRVEDAPGGGALFRATIPGAPPAAVTP